MSEWFWIQLVKYLSQLLGFVAWPITAVAICILLRKLLASVLNNFFSGNKRTLETRWGKLVIEKIGENENFNKFQRDELAGLTANEIWALENFVQEPALVSDMPPARKVMAVVLKEAKMVEVINNQVVATDFGRKIVKAAKEISL
jgi:hypothetical protein